MGWKARRSGARAGKPETGRITLERLSRGRPHHHRDRRRRPRPRHRPDPPKALAKGLATEAELAAMTRAADPALHLPRRLLHRRRGHRRLRPRRRHGRGQDQHREDRRHRSRCARREGQGTTFIIKIPLTLAIVSALIVECAGERFAIPQIGVVELVRAAASGELRGRAHQGHAGAAPARPAAAAGLAAQAAAARTPPKRSSEDDTFVVVTQVGTHASASSSTASSTPRRSW